MFAGQLAFAGSVSGGGGGTLPGDKIEAKDVLEAVADSRSVIDAFLKGVETWIVLEDGTTPKAWYHDYDKMFAPGADVFKLLNKVSFRIVSNGTYHDVGGSETDASANTDIEGGICISVSNIQPKVSFSNYRAEIGALILHEISHLYGSDEKEAVSIQKIAVRFFAGKSPSDILSWNFRVMESLRSLSSMTEMLSDALKSGAKIPCSNVGKLESAFMSTVHDLVDGGSNMLLTRERDAQYYWQLSTRVMAMQDFLCTQQGDEYEDVRQWSVDRFNKIWGNDTELSADTYLKRAVNDQSKFNRYPLVTVKIKKYTSPTELPQDLDFAQKDIKTLNNLIQGQFGGS